MGVSPCPVAVKTPCPAAPSVAVRPRTQSAQGMLESPMRQRDPQRPESERPISLLDPPPRAADLDAADPVVVWGKRVGRVIGYGLLIVLAVNLFTGWFF